MEKYVVSRSVSDKVLVVGEYFKGAPGGIAAVLQYYRPHWETFKFVPSSRKMTRVEKVVFGLGGFFLMFFRLLFDWKIRIVHIHTAAGGSFTKHQHYVRLAKFMGRKVILHSHASRFKVFFDESSSRRKSSILKTLNSLDRLIVLSVSWKQWFESIGVNPAKITILNNITPEPSTPHVPSSDGTLRLLFLGEIGDRKGVFDLLRALTDHKDEFSGKIFLHVGGNGQVEKIRMFIADNQLDGLVKFDGFVSGDLKTDLLSHADVFVLPSFNEGLPISILEAMSYGCTIISTPVGGIPEVVSDANGILVPPGDSEALASAVRFLLMDPAMVESTGNASRKIVRKFYPEPVLTDLVGIYRQLLNQ